MGRPLLGHSTLIEQARGTVVSQANYALTLLF